ncbi:MAG: SPOR domain-containing protein [Nitrospirota bacterium]
MLGETILVIDTDTETTQQIVSTLESEDYLVFTAQSGDIGLTMAKKINPLLIFVNPAMTGTSGLEVCKTIHSTKSLKNIPIVVLSTFEGATDPRYTALYGIVGSLKKPFSPEELVSKTREILSMKSFDVQPGTEFEQSEAEEDSGFNPEEETLIKGQEMPEFPPVMPDFGKKVSEEADFSDRTAVKTPEDMDFADKTLVTMKEDIHSFDDKTLTKQIKSDAEEEKTDYIHTPGKKSDEGISGERERTYVLKKNIRRRGMRNSLLVPIIAGVVIIIILGTSGIILYKKGLLPGLKPKALVAVKPAQPVQQETAKATPSQEQQTSQQAGKPAPAQTPAAPVLATKAVPAPVAKPVDKPAPVPILAVKPSTTASTPKPEAKPSAKAAFHIQVGAFKNEANAAALTNQYKDKGYDAFTSKAQKEKEIIYRVLIGKFENRKEASKLAEDIGRKEKIKAIVFKE